MTLTIQKALVANLELFNQRVTLNTHLPMSDHSKTKELNAMLPSGIRGKNGLEVRFTLKDLSFDGHVKFAASTRVNETSRRTHRKQSVDAFVRVASCFTGFLSSEQQAKCSTLQAGVSENGYVTVTDLYDLHDVIKQYHEQS